MTPAAAPSVVSAGDVAVIVVNYNAGAHLLACLKALHALAELPAEIIVVDNDSTDDSITQAKEHYPAVQYIELLSNTGFAAANNTAIAATQKPWVWLVNPDAFVKTDCLQTLLGEVSENNNVKAFSAELVSANDHAQLDGQGDCYHISGLVWRRKHGQERSGRQSTLPMFSPCAASALYSREAVLEVGGFDEDYFCYIEDVDLGFRLRLAGYDCLHVKDAITYHVGSAITERDSDFSIYHGHRNLVWTYFKNMPTAKLWQCLPQHLLMNLVSIVYYSLKGRPGVILKAKWHAIKGLHSHIQKRKKPAQGTQSVVNFMAGGWLTPYRGRHD